MSDRSDRPETLQVASQPIRTLAQLIDDGGDVEEILTALTTGDYTVSQLQVLATQDAALAACLLDLVLKSHRERLSSEQALLEELRGLGRHRSRDDRENSDGNEVLLVEDDREFRKALKEFLEAAGYKVHDRNNGVEALLQFNKRWPDLVLCDLYMPRMNGFKLMMEIKKQDVELPFVLMTGSPTAEQAFETFKYPNVSFLPKPFRLSELGARIRTMLEGQR